MLHHTNPSPNAMLERNISQRLSHTGCIEVRRHPECYVACQFRGSSFWRQTIRQVSDE